MSCLGSKYTIGSGIPWSECSSSKHPGLIWLTGLGYIFLDYRLVSWPARAFGRQWYEPMLESWLRPMGPTLGCRSKWWTPPGWLVDRLVGQPKSNRMFLDSGFLSITRLDAPHGALCEPLIIFLYSCSSVMQ
ncbi:hypothetical protein Nepgr_024356 [Nepenthes gracilis]|uniref:Uncharacterized protein n=1 Tax=Nepenthes gracilis TaxID=150966 RepID=A0AAD3XYQ6_NEPGR|nr:hypothetical protein Nepgr_024356 [Nepenthes gracilis]